MTKKRVIGVSIVAAAIVVLMIVAAITTNAESVQKSFWALVPPVIAIVLALVTKEVYSSLFIGIIAGALLYSGFNFEGTAVHIFQGGVISVLSDSWNVGIIVFLVILGTMVAMINRAGGSAAFGRWSEKHIKTRAGAQMATIFLGILIFIDDYFNCLTVGSVMRPVTDKHQVSKAKLAYLIDSTAAPICIIAPISSWAAAVTGFVDGTDGMSLFLQAIPYNFYALLTIFMMFALVKTNTDFGPMALHEKNAQKGDIYTTKDRPYSVDEEETQANPNGKVKDLIIPIIVLIGACVIGMIYTGGFFAGEDFITAFSNSDASLGLVLGSFFALVFMIVFYLIRRVVSFKDCMKCLPSGFKAMVPAILILTFAWSLKAMTDSLGAKEFVAGLVEASAADFLNFLPAIIFIIACFLAFATGTSWGTFGILIPIVVVVFQGVDYQLMVISISACMAGAVCGDHCSPISDTTIMASAGAQCNHINHVSTQLPYAITVAVVSCLCYIIAGFSRNFALPLAVGVALLLIVLVALRKARKSKKDIGIPV